MERTQLLCKDACILGASTKLNLLVVLKQLVKATRIEFLLLADKVTWPSADFKHGLLFNNYA